MPERGQPKQGEDPAQILVGFLDLPWDPACLRFHQSPRAVATARADGADTATRAVKPAAHAFCTISKLARLVMNIAYPTRRHLPAKVRCFVDFLVQHFAAMDYERRWTA